MPPMNNNIPASPTGRRTVQVIHHISGKAVVVEVPLDCGYMQKLFDEHLRTQHRKKALYHEQLDITLLRGAPRAVAYGALMLNLPLQTICWHPSSPPAASSPDANPSPTNVHLKFEENKE
jgi:hypothetical protein